MRDVKIKELLLVKVTWLNWLLSSWLYEDDKEDVLEKKLNLVEEILDNVLLI